VILNDNSLENDRKWRSGRAGSASEAPLASAQRRSGSSALNVTAAVLGNALEFYDFGVYGAYAVFIGRAFFPNESALASLLLSLATYGVGFVARPLADGDRRLRRPARPQARHDLDDLADGDRHRHDRGAPDLCDDRRRGPHPARAGAPDPGLLDRR